MWSHIHKLLHLPAAFVKEELHIYWQPCSSTMLNCCSQLYTMQHKHAQTVHPGYLFDSFIFSPYLGLILCLFYQFQWDYSFCIKDLDVTTTVTSLFFLIYMVLLNPFNWIHFINSRTDADIWKEYGLNKWANIHHFYSTQYDFLLESVVTSQNKCILIPSDLFLLQLLLCHSWMHLSKPIGI